MIFNLDKYFNLRNTVSQFFLFLSAFAAIATFDLFSTSGKALQNQYLMQIVIVIFSSLTILYIFREVLGHAHFNPLNFFITTLITYLIVDPSTVWILFPITLLIAMGGKLIRYENQPIFNPAGLGMFLTYFLTVFLRNVGLTGDVLIVSWWGADLQQTLLQSSPLMNVLTASILLYCFLFFVTKFRKVVYVGSFFMTVMLMVFYTNLTLMHSSIETIRFLTASLFNAFAFMALVMIPEPKTSPAFMKQQLVIGIIGGFLFYMVMFKGLGGIFADIPMIPIILGMNLITCVVRKRDLLTA